MGNQLALGSVDISDEARSAFSIFGHDLELVFIAHRHAPGRAPRQWMTLTVFTKDEKDHKEDTEHLISVHHAAPGIPRVRLLFVGGVKESVTLCDSPWVCGWLCKQEPSGSVARC